MGESVDLAPPAKPQPDQLESQPHQELIKITEGNQQEPFTLKGIGREINRLSNQEDSFGLPVDMKVYRFTHPSRLKPGLRVMDAIQSAEKIMGTGDRNRSTLTEQIAGQQTLTICLLLAKQLGLSPQEIAQNLTPQEGETPGKFLMRLIEWQIEMMEKMYQQK
jgi:hypothetical protein